MHRFLDAYLDRKKKIATSSNLDRSMIKKKFF